MGNSGGEPPNLPTADSQEARGQARSSPVLGLALKWASWRAGVLSCRAGGVVCSSLGTQTCQVSLLAAGLPGAQSALKRRIGSRNKEASVLDEKIVRREENETNKG